MTAYLRSLFWIGILALFLPYIGIPQSIKGVLAILIGCTLVFLSFAIGKQYKFTRLKLRRLEQSAPQQHSDSNEQQ